MLMFYCKIKKQICGAFSELRKIRIYKKGKQIDSQVYNLLLTANST